jgi:hypothetical protein
MLEYRRVLHAIDPVTKERLWSVDTGGPLMTSSQGQRAVEVADTGHDNDSDFVPDHIVLPTIDGSLLVQSNEDGGDGGMRKTSVKARLLAEKAPFISQDGILYTSEKASRVFSIDIDSGEMFSLGVNGAGISTGTNVIDSVSNTGTGAGFLFSQKPEGGVGKGAGAGFKGIVQPITRKKRSLWIGRTDYTLHAYDGVTGSEKVCECVFSV